MTITIHFVLTPAFHPMATLMHLDCWIITTFICHFYCDKICMNVSCSEIVFKWVLIFLLSGQKLYARYPSLNTNCTLTARRRKIKITPKIYLFNFAYRHASLNFLLLRIFFSICDKVKKVPIFCCIK